MTPAIPRLFVLRRDQDVTGVSGPGDIADGVQWPDGTVALRWRERPSTSIWDSLELMLSVHGHDGATRVVWLYDATIPMTEHLEAANRAQVEIERLRAVAGRAYLLADRWQSAHGQSMFLVRAAGAELRDELDGTDTRGRDITVTGVVRMVDAASDPTAEPCTKHRGQERQRLGCNGPDPDDQARLAAGPLTGIEVRDPCPHCNGWLLIPRSLLDDHIRQQHPEVRDDGVELAREALLARMGDDQAEAVDRLIRAVERRAVCDLPHEMEA